MTLSEFLIVHIEDTGSYTEKLLQKWCLLFILVQFILNIRCTMRKILCKQHLVKYRKYRTMVIILCTLFKMMTKLVNKLLKEYTSDWRPPFHNL